MTHDSFNVSQPVLDAFRDETGITVKVLTAGDAGNEDTYWQSRERGIEAAYASMAGVTNAWSTATVSLGGKSVRMRTLSAAPSVSVAAPAMASVPVRKLNEIGGEFPAWSADGRKVMWGLGNAVWTFDLDRAKVVDGLAGVVEAVGPEVRTLTVGDFVIIGGGAVTNA